MRSLAILAVFLACGVASADEVKVYRYFKVMQVTSDSSAMVKIGSRNFWYTGDTSTWVDDQYVKDRAVVETKKTHRYTSVGGSVRTIRVLRDATIEEIRELAAKASDSDRNIAEAKARVVDDAVWRLEQYKEKYELARKEYAELWNDRRHTVRLRSGSTAIKGGKLVGFSELRTPREFNYSRSRWDKSPVVVHEMRCWEELTKIRGSSSYALFMTSKSLVAVDIGDLDDRTLKRVEDQYRSAMEIRRKTGFAPDLFVCVLTTAGSTPQGGGRRGGSLFFEWDWGWSNEKSKPKTIKYNPPKKRAD